MVHKNFNPIAVAAAIVALFPVFSCTDDGGIQELPSEEFSYKMDQVKAVYNGEKDGLGLFVFDFSNGSADLHLELYSDVVPEEDLLDANLAPGNYTADTVAAKGVLLAGDSWFSAKDGNGDNSDLAIAGGSVYIVVTEGCQMAFITDLTMSDGSRLECEYNGPVDIEPVYTTVFEAQTGWFWGDSEWDYPGIGQYMVIFYKGEYDGQGLIEGESLSFDFYSVMPEEAWNAEIPEGTYTTTTEYAMNTVLVATEEIRQNERYKIWGYANYQTIQEGVDSVRFIVDGTVKVSKTADEYVMKFNFLCEDGIRVVGKYSGPVVQGDEYTRTTLTEDVVMENLGFGYLEYEGPSPMQNIKGVNRWNIRLYDNTLRVEPDQYWGIYNDSYGEYIVMQVFTDGSYTEYIPEGRYVISEEEVPYHINQGQGGFGFNFATWYNYFEEGEYIQQAPAITGEVNISRDGTEYIIDIEIVDDRGNTITANYQGELTYWNSYDKPEPVMPKWLLSPCSGFDAERSYRVVKDLEETYGDRMFVR